MVNACSPSQIIKQSVLELKLQAEESFVLKVVQLQELLQVRHSVFVIGNAGCGKSQVAAKPSLRTRVPPAPGQAQPIASPIISGASASHSQQLHQQLCLGQGWQRSWCQWPHQTLEHLKCQAQHHGCTVPLRRCCGRSTRHTET